MDKEVGLGEEEGYEGGEGECEGVGGEEGVG